MNDGMKLYYVTGKDFMGNTKTVKTYATDPKQARWNAGWVLATPGTVRRG